MAQCVTVNETGCGFYRHARKWNIYLNSYFNFFALVSWKNAVVFRHSIRNASRIRWKLETECLNTRFSPPTLLCAEYSVKRKQSPEWRLNSLSSKLSTHTIPLNHFSFKLLLAKSIYIKFRSFGWPAFICHSARVSVTL